MPLGATEISNEDPLQRSAGSIASLESVVVIPMGVLQFAD